MNATIVVANSQAETYARRIALVGSLKRLARKCSIIETAIVRDLERRRNRGESPQPLNRAAFLPFG
jgi:hypothetical protein